ncbi:hypothetical protein G7Y89_g9447 [Cudoniella acicularis]|uniref:Heterokaryon incompatibility domain-containing protein n=1 Tax=Cudoniella acicularis TaxID=354080 RepID=A0A8H4VZM4_9HELO|nr:hypothetical protein G7Y89_g9447 [Cudoniella acicularis]
MAECFEEHEGRQHKPKESLPQGFRVIDVIRRRIVEMNDCSFVALSYVWGLDSRPSLLTATCATIEEMKKDGGLPASEMPQTIEDAITVCAQLGERYLWADRLCIIQDSAEDKRNQIDAMGDIYSSARLVLIVAYGDSMDFGIPGIGHPREIVQHHGDVSGLRVTNIIGEVEGDPLALWHTRGWTYQEAVLAKRRLYFTNVRAFFEYGQSICHEDQYNREGLRNEFASHELLIAEDGSRFDTFARHLKNYTSRSLKYQSDAYNAFTGISKSLYDKGGVFLNGLPQADFDRALRWYADIGNNVTTRLEHPGMVLPTWSWSSVMTLQDPVNYQATKLFGTLVPWYTSDPSFPPALLKPFNIHADTITDDDWQVYMAIACSEGCVANISFSLPLKTSNFSTVREKFSTRWQSYHMFFKEAIDRVPMTIEYPQTSPLLPQKNGAFLKNLKPGVILTRAQAAFLRLAKRPERSGLHIVDSGGEFVGELCGDVARLERDVTSPQHDTNTLFEFIALSLSGKRILAYSGNEKKTKNYFDKCGNSLAVLPIVNLLVIGWRGSYAYRRELGWIYLVDWAKTDREWKTVLLE